LNPDVDARFRSSISTADIGDLDGLEPRGTEDNVLPGGQLVNESCNAASRGRALDPPRFGICYGQLNRVLILVAAAMIVR